MKADQFIEILKLVSKQNVSISYDKITKLSCLQADIVEEILKKYKNCEPENKKFFLEIMFNEEFITYYGYSTILNIIAGLQKEEVSGIKYMLTKEFVTNIPNLMDYINLYYELIVKPYIAYAQENIPRIAKAIPEVEYESASEILKEILLEKFDYAYNHYVTDIDVFFLEDYDGLLEDKVVKYYLLKRKNKKESPNKLIRKLTKEGLIEPSQNKIIAFKKED